MFNAFLHSSSGSSLLLKLVIASMGYVPVGSDCYHKPSLFSHMDRTGVLTTSDISSVQTAGCYKTDMAGMEPSWLINCLALIAMLHN